MKKPHWMKRKGIWFKFDSREHRDQFVAQIRAGKAPTNTPWMFRVSDRSCKAFVAKGCKFLGRLPS